MEHFFKWLKSVPSVWNYQNTNKQTMGEKGGLYSAGFFSGSLAASTLWCPWQDWTKQQAKEVNEQCQLQLLSHKSCKYAATSEASQFNSAVRGDCRD
jgi:hypothetical protein